MNSAAGRASESGRTRRRAVRSKQSAARGTMSPGSGVKSEYMKRYREPRWDEYAPCYRELLRYRLGRRLLEQAHAPWLWDAWGPDSPSDSSASPSPAPRGALGEPSAPSAREEEQPVGERGAELRDAEKQDTVLPGTGPGALLCSLGRRFLFWFGLVGVDRIPLLS